MVGGRAFGITETTFATTPFVATLIPKRTKAKSLRPGAFVGSVVLITWLEAKKNTTEEYLYLIVSFPSWIGTVTGGIGRMLT